MQGDAIVPRDRCVDTGGPTNMKRSLGFCLLPVAAALVYLVGCGHRDDAPSPKPAPQATAVQVPIQPPPLKDNIDGIVAAGADGSVQQAKNDYGIVLDYSPASIKKVDVILLKLHGRYVKDKTNHRWRMEGLGWGAYVGEVIVRQYGGHWDTVDSDTGKPLPLIWRNGTVFPATWCFSQIVDGTPNGLWSKYQLLTSPEYMKAFASVKKT